MSPTKIGYYDRGALSVRRDVNATASSTLGVTYDQALARTRATSGADLIVARESGGAFRYDVYDVAIEKENRLAGAGQFLRLVDNVPGTLNASEAVLVDEANSAQVLLSASESNDSSRGRRIITHARSRDIEGALALTTSVTNSAMRSQLSAALEGLKPVRQALETREAGLRSDLQQAEQALATKRAPYDQAIATAEGNLSRTSSHHASIVSGKQRNLREVTTPGIHQAEADVRTRESERGSAQSALGSAQSRLSAAQGQIADADRMRGELNQMPYRISTVRRKLDDYEDNRREYEIEMRHYRTDLSRYESELRQWEQSSQYQNQPSGSGYQNQPSGSGYQNQPSGSGYQNEPSGSNYQNQPSGSGYQNQPSGSGYQNQPSGPRPVRPIEPTLRTPSSWSWGDTEYGLRSELTTLERRVYTLTADEARTRSEGTRNADSARDQIRSAELGLARADDRLEAARTHLRTLPAGDPATIQRAEGELRTAQTAQTNALRPLQATLTEARQALDTNTQQERAQVAQVQADLQAAPQAYLTAVSEAERIVTTPPATPTPTPSTPSTGGGYTPTPPTRARRNSP